MFNLYPVLQAHVYVPIPSTHLWAQLLVPAHSFISVIRKRLLLCNYNDIPHNTSGAPFFAMNYTNLSTLKMSFMGIQVKKSLKQTETKKTPKTQKTEIMIHILHFVNKLKPESASFDFSIESYPHTCLIAYFCCNHSYKHNHNFRPSFGSENWLGRHWRSWYIR